ncbi:DUF2254 family protein [Dinoroseobacter sp. S375]|uniref:DUF2254 family protein n=1 Tax=Dinoroseobacter sp. S375 TaxID=3415136 RepID=UPI003C7C4344
MPCVSSVFPNIAEDNFSGGGPHGRRLKRSGLCEEWDACDETEVDKTRVPSLLSTHGVARLSVCALVRWCDFRKPSLKRGNRFRGCHGFLSLSVTPVLTIFASSMLAASTFSLSIVVSAHRTIAETATPRMHRIPLEDMTPSRRSRYSLGHLPTLLVRWCSTGWVSTQRVRPI